MNPLISIIVPIYNVGAYLFQCVQSLTRQTYQSLEIILVNDGSTDSCPEICEYFRKTDDRIKVINQANSGLVNARKTGIHQASGEFIVFVDGDDWLDLTYIESLINLQMMNQVDLVIPSHYREFMGIRTKMHNPQPIGIYDRPDIQASIFPQLISLPPFYQPSIFTYSWGKLYKKELVTQPQLQTPSNLVMGEDAAVVYPVIAACQRLMISDIAGYNYRQRPNSILKTTHSLSDELSKLALLRTHLWRQLQAYTSFDFRKQLDDFILAYAMIRTGCFFADPQFIPLTQISSAIPKNSKICLYNSGSFGQQMYKSIQKSKYYEIVAWLDEDYQESQLMGLPIVAPQSIQAFDYDFVVIAILDPVRVSEITQLLTSMGVQSNRILSPKANSASSTHALKKLGFVDLTAH